VFPPWQHGENNDATSRGFEFTVPQVDDLADFHGDITDPKLVLYVGGNYFFAMAPLVAEFEKEHPDYKGRIYWETIPPGLLVKQIEAGGTITSGNMTWTAKPDAYLAGLKKVDALIDQGLLTGHAVPYVTNTLTIMVPKGNPGHVTDLADLGKPDIRLAMPNPEFEGIARQIETSLKKAGGQALADAVYKTKVADGSTILTHIHHRQTPLFLMQGRADAGVTWQSEGCSRSRRDTRSRMSTSRPARTQRPSTPARWSRERHTGRQPSSGFPSSTRPRRCRSSSATGSSLTLARRQTIESRDSQHRRRT
jgi:ABC-type molybdate transport system substrate-binding protein